METTQATLREQLQFGLGDRLGKALHVAGLTSQDMAEALEVSRNTVSNYVNGNTRPRKLYIREWALKTGVPIEWLETGRFPGEPETEKAATHMDDGQTVRPEVFETPTLSVKYQNSHMADVLPFRKAS